jgi:hypothetical protein
LQAQHDRATGGVGRSNLMHAQIVTLGILDHGLVLLHPYGVMHADADVAPRAEGHSLVQTAERDA